jgi:phospholipid/cholesterol/gamma-HCH transport system ATP-binding protein
MSGAADIKIGIKGLSKAFGRNRVLQGLDLDIARRESVVIIGGSGTGKSVLLKCILGLLHPDAGSIAIDGEETTSLSSREREAFSSRFGMLFQGAALFDSLSVWENVTFGLLATKAVTRKEAKDVAIANLAKVGLKPEVALQFPAELSGGMKKRVGLARAIASKPEILFFDEPTTGLDPIMSGVINELIVEQVKDLGATALTITHDMASAKTIADRIGMLYQGRIIWLGPVSEIEKSGNPYVEQFIHGRSEGPIDMEVRG